MVIAFSSSPYGLSSPTDFKQLGIVLPIAGSSFVNIQWAPTPATGVIPINPQTILSVQPDGSYQTRNLNVVPAGEFEQFLIVGETLCIRPNFNPQTQNVFQTSFPSNWFVIAMKVVGQG